MNIGTFKKGKLIARSTEAKDLEMESRRGVLPELRKSLEESLAVDSRKIEKSPGYTDFLHKVEEIVSSKVIVSNQPGTTSKKLPHFVGKTEQRLAKQFKERS